MTSIAERHRELAARFSDLVSSVTDWDAPTPVKEWRARDIVAHLTGWLPGMLGSMGVDLPAVEQADKPADAWAEHTANVQALVEDEELLGRVVETPSGEQSVSAVLEQYYLPDVFMHSWDLAKASGQDPKLDPAQVKETVDGMTPMVDMLAGSGQFGEPKVLDESHSYEDRLIALIGRDPNWTPTPA